jgi:hypothetical protein
MTRYNIQLFVCLITTLLPLPVLAQVAQVYVSTPTEIYAFNAASDGKLTEVPGSPFPATTEFGNPAMVVNGEYLFVIDSDPNTNSYETSRRRQVS